MNTPRTDAAWAKTFEDDDDQCRAGNAATDMRDACATLERELTALTAERDELRGALALGQQNCDDVYDELRADCDELRADVVRLTARAERAEAELSTEREKSERYRLATLKLDAELAVERARLDSGTILLIVAGERVWHCGVDLRAAIDAAMKEDAQ